MTNHRMKVSFEVGVMGSDETMARSRIEVALSKVFAFTDDELKTLGIVQVGGSPVAVVPAPETKTTTTAAIIKEKAREARAKKG
jgi:hypothetical protein